VKTVANVNMDTWLRLLLLAIEWIVPAAMCVYTLALSARRSATAAYSLSVWRARMYEPFVYLFFLIAFVAVLVLGRTSADSIVQRAAMSLSIAGPHVLPAAAHGITVAGCASMAVFGSAVFRAAASPGAFLVTVAYYIINAGAKYPAFRGALWPMVLSR